MRKIVRWAENAAAKIERNKKVTRWKRGNELIKASRPTEWLSPDMNAPIDARTIELKATIRLDNLIDQRDALNLHKLKIQRKLEAMENIREGERPSPSFYLSYFIL